MTNTRPLRLTWIVWVTMVAVSLAGLFPAHAAGPEPTATATAPIPLPIDASRGAAAGAKVYLDALQGRDFERVVSAASDLAVLAIGLSREDYRRRLETLASRGYRIWSWEILSTRLTDADNAVVQVSSKLQTNAVSQPQTVLQELAMHRENGVWRVGPAGLVDYQILDTAPQTVNGVTVRPLRLIRFKDYFQIGFNIINDSDRAILWGYGGTRPGACQFDGQVKDAAPYQKTIPIGSKVTVANANLVVPGAQTTYPTWCEALNLRWADPNSPSTADQTSPPWTYRFALPPVALPPTPAAPEAPGVTLAGHTDGVAGVAVSLDGKMVATASSDQTARLWDAATGQLIRTLTGHTGFLTTVAFSPDGKTLASAGEDGPVRLWDTGTGQFLRSLSGSAKGTVSVAFSPDGKLLASGGLDNAVRLWDPATGQELRTLSGHSDAVSDVAFSPDGQVLASSSKDGTVRLWDAATGRELRTLPGHTEAVLAVAFSPDGKMLASAGADLTVRLWDTASGQEIRKFTDKPTAFGLAFSPDGKTLATSGPDKVVRVWDVATGQDLHTFSGHQDMVLNLAFTPDGKTLASVSADKTAKLWRLP